MPHPGWKGAFGLRDRLTSRFGRYVDARVEHLAPIAEHHERLAELQRLVDHQEASVLDHRRRLAEMDERFTRLNDAQHWANNELERIIPQLAAQDSQLEALERKLAGGLDQAREGEAARSLIAEIRRQHAQIRVRLTGVAQYEDRLRKLEDRRSREDAG